jgi:hypothetical protein
VSYAFDPEVAALIPLLPAIDADPAEMRAAMESLMAGQPATAGVSVELRLFPGTFHGPAYWPRRQSRAANASNARRYCATRSHDSGD